MNSDKTIDIYKTPILYVDDEQDNITSFLMDFEDYFNIYTALNASDGLDILNKNDIGLIISDERMPGMSACGQSKKLELTG